MENDTKLSEGKNRERKILIVAIAAAIVITSIIGVVKFSDVEIFDSNGSPSLKTGSEHVHAWFKVYLIGDQINFFPREYPEFGNAGEYIFLDPAQDGTVLHRFSKDATLQVFFESVEMEFNQECFVVSDYLMEVQPRIKQKEYCVDEKNKLYFFVNEEPNESYEKYVFNKLDTILIAYGEYDEADIFRLQRTIGWGGSALG